MNFLLHYAFAEHEEGRAEEAPAHVVGLGAMLPDLWRMADRALRTHASPGWHGAREGEPSAALRALLRGVAHHLRADEWFHRTSVFREGERALSRALLPLAATKLVLFAHPIWEMCLDGALVTKRGASTISVELSLALGEAASEMHAALELSVSPEARALADLDRYRRRMDWFTRSASDATLFLDYAHAEGVARRVVGMRAAFGLPAPDANDLARWSDAIAPFIARAEQELPTLFEERERVSRITNA